VTWYKEVGKGEGGKKRVGSVMEMRNRGEGKENDMRDGQRSHRGQSIATMTP